MPPMGCTPHLKMKLPHLKNTPPPPLKSEAPFHEMIPRKSTAAMGIGGGIWKCCRKCRPMLVL